MCEPAVERTAWAEYAPVLAFIVRVSQLAPSRLRRNGRHVEERSSLKRDPDRSLRERAGGEVDGCEDEGVVREEGAEGI